MKVGAEDEEELYYKVLQIVQFCRFQCLKSKTLYICGVDRVVDRYERVNDYIIRC